MRPILKLLTAAVIITFQVGICKAKEWHGIVPLQSTRQDVTRLLGKPADANDLRANYLLEKEDVFVVFSNEKDFQQECVKQLPLGTVLLIQVRPKTDVPLAEFHVEDGKFRKFDPGSGWYPGMEGYISDEAGLVLRVEHGKVSEICYIATSEERKRCPEYYKNSEEMVHVGVPHPTKFDEWSDIRFRDERARLDNAMFSLQQRADTIMYLIIYAGKTACVGEAKARGLRAKNYLVRTRAVKPDRIVWIDGGYRVSQVTQVWIWPRALAQDAPVPDFGLNPSNVKLEQNCTIKYRGGT